MPLRITTKQVTGVKLLRQTIFLTVVTLLLALSMGVAHAGHVKFGVFIPEQTISALETFESKTGYKQDIYSIYRDWNGTFETTFMTELVNRGTTPMITWEPWDRSLDSIIAGDHDAYITAFAQGAKQVPGTVMLRPAHEMNGWWYPWGAQNTANTPDKYKAAWKHIVDIFNAENVTNVSWVWSPNVNGLPGRNTDSIPWYYPGDSYVDIVALDAFNFGTFISWSSWRSFDSLYKAAYNKVLTFTNKPMMIGEVGSVEQGGSKAAWIKDMYTTIERSYPRIRYLVWFNLNSDTEGDHRIESSASSIAAYQSIRPPYAYISNPWGWLLQQGYGSLWVVAPANAPKGMAKVTFSIDGKLVGQDYASPYAYKWDLGTMSSGWHIIKVNAFDKAWNLKTVTKWVRVDADRWGPSLFIANPTATTVYSRYGALWLVASAYDANGIAKTTFYIDGKLVHQDYGYPYAWKWPISGVKKGWHTITVNAFDTKWNLTTKSRLVFVTQ